MNLNAEHEIFLTPESFLVIIQERMKNSSINHIDAILEYCEDQGVEVEDVIPLITRPMKELITADAVDSGLMKSASSRLPV